MVLINRHEHRLLPGREVSISGAARRSLNSVLSDDLARRNIKETEVGALKVVGADFSLLDALIKHPLLLAVRSSSRPEDRNLIKHIQKTAAAISMTVDRGAGPYYEPKIEPNSSIASSPNERIF